ncbi:MAG: hypothetical protein HFE63_09115 [Clostridiales bacterium]|nr:hypothetical protein [Clostridiales bacterium]
MKLRIYMLLSALFIIFALPSCGIHSDVSTNTGYPSGQIQREMLYYDGSVWGRDFYGDDNYGSGRYLDELPSGYTLVGEITSEDSYNIPAVDFQSAHIKVGVKVYASDENSDYIYLEDSDKTKIHYDRFLKISIN